MILFAAWIAAAGCGAAADRTDYSGILHFDTTAVRIVTNEDSIRVWVEVASSVEQRAMGLMERSSMPDSAGMLFVYGSDQPATAGFWMFRTRLPLDIAFLDSTGVVVAIRNMAPCRAELAVGCPTYEPGVPYRTALEVNAGFLARHSISAGSRVLMPGVLAR